MYVPLGISHYAYSKATVINLRINTYMIYSCTSFLIMCAYVIIMHGIDVPYSLNFSRGKIFADFEVF